MAATVLAVAVATLFYSPIAVHPNSTVLREPNDLTSTARDYWAAHQLGKTPFTLVRDTLFHAPGGQVLSPAVQVANALQPLAVLALHPAAGYLGAMNLYALIGITLTLLATYFLLRSQNLHPLACGSAAIAFASSQFTIEQLLYGHSAFAQMWVFPALLAALHWGRRGGRDVRAVMPGVVLAASFYASSYLGLFTTAACLLFVMVAAFEGDRSDRRILLRRFALGGAAASALMLPAILAPRLTPSTTLNLPSWGKQNLVGANVADFFLPSSRNPLYGGIAGTVVGRHVGESVDFFGYGVLLLAAFAVASAARNWSNTTTLVRFAIVAVPAGWWLSMPAYAHIGGLSILLPDAAGMLGGAVPWWRIYARFASLAGFGLVILASVALDRLLRKRGQIGRAFALAAAATLVLEAVPGFPVESTRLRPDFAARWLVAHPGGIAASYPTTLIGHDVDAWDRTYWGFYCLQLYHRHPIFAPPQGEPEPTTTEISSYLAENLNDPMTPAILSAEHVRYVIVRDWLYRGAHERPPRPRDLLRLGGDGRTTIYRVVAKPVGLSDLLRSREPQLARSFVFGDPSIEFGSGFYPAEHYNGWTAAHWLSQDGVIDLRPSVNRAFVVYTLRLWAFSNGVERKLSIFANGHRIAVFTIPGHEVQVQANLRLPEAMNHLTLTASPVPAPLGPADRRRGSVYVENLEVEPTGLALDGGRTSA